jgi:hypothetical protein
LFLLFVCFAFADEFYSPYQHGRTISRRLRTIEKSNIRSEKELLRLEERERKTLNTLQVLYDDMKIAVSQRDRIDIEKAVERRQKALNKIRSLKRVVLRKMRHMADKIAQPYRDEMVRKTRTEERLGYDYNSHIRREIAETHEAITKETMELAKKYATMASEVAVAKVQEKLSKNGDDLSKAKVELEKAAQKEYIQVYKKIVNTINEATLNGVDQKDVKMVCYSAIQDYAQKIENDHILLVSSIANAQKDVKVDVDKALKQIAPKVTENFAKNMKNTVKTDKKNGLKDKEIEGKTSKGKKVKGTKKEKKVVKAEKKEEKKVEKKVVKASKKAVDTKEAKKTQKEEKKEKQQRSDKPIPKSPKRG